MTFAVVAAFVFVATSSNAQTRRLQTQRQNTSGDQVESAPVLTASYKSVGTDGETFVVETDCNDIDGGKATVSAYVNRVKFAEIVGKPQAFFIGRDVYGQLPFTVELICRDLWGNGTLMEFAITSVGFNDTLDCTFQEPTKRSLVMTQPFAKLETQEQNSITSR